MRLRRLLRHRGGLGQIQHLCIGDWIWGRGNCFSNPLNDIARNAAENDKNGRRKAKDGRQKKDYHKNHSRRKIDEAGFCHLEHGIQDQDANACAYADKGMADGGIRLKFRQACCHERNDKDTRKNDAKGCEDAAQTSFLLYTDKGGRIDGNDTGRALSDGKIIVEFRMACPVAVFNNFGRSSNGS